MLRGFGGCRISSNLRFKRNSLERAVGEKSGLTIGWLARRAKCSVPSVRYYEEIGLLPAARRLEGGHRVYDAEDVRRAVFIRRCREFGFSIIRIRDLLGVSDGEPCSAARDIAQTHLDEIRSKLRELTALEASLARFVSNCDTGCGGRAARDCSLFADLATHDLYGNGDGTAKAMVIPRRPSFKAPA